MGIEGQKLLTPEDDYEALREFNAGYEGERSLLENLHLDLQNLLKEIPELKGQLNNMPGAIFSGRALPKKEQKGYFSALDYLVGIKIMMIFLMILVLQVVSI